MVKKIEIERVSVPSYRPFDEVIAAINDCDRPSRYHGILEINSTDPQGRKSFTPERRRIENWPVQPDSRGFGVPGSFWRRGIAVTSCVRLGLVPGNELPGTESSRSSGKAGEQLLRWFACARGAAHTGDKGSRRCRPCI